MTSARFRRPSHLPRSLVTAGLSGGMLLTGGILSLAVATPAAAATTAVASPAGAAVTLSAYQVLTLPALTQLLSTGSRGPLVMIVQQKVGVGVDGDFGPITQAGVVRFQRSRGLTVDGVVGPQTWGAMGTSAPAPASAAAASRAQVTTSSRAAVAVRYALSKVGGPWVYAGTGPTAYDCSGLTMMAWRAAGVSLPHNSTEQFHVGTPVSRSQLQPGDLLFFYSGVSHVGMYIGNNQMVQAANPRSGIQVVSLSSYWWGVYDGARRV